MDREDAINIVRKNIPHLGLGATEMTEALGILIPELRESEDERVIRTLFFLCKDHDWLNGATKEECLNWLEKQKEQNPVDDDNPLNDPRFIDGFDTGREVQKIFDEPTKWSEEDNRLLDFWLDVIDRNDWRMDENFCKASREFIKRLKSLRPSWKPSEEQIEALEIIVRYGDKESMHIKKLTSLLEQLKQLCL